MALGNIMGTDGIIVIVVLLIVVFGGSQLPKIAKNVGSAGKEFRKAQEEADKEHRAQEAAKAQATPPPAVTAAPAAPVAPAAEDDKLTISKSELNALLDEREARARNQANN